MELKVPPAGESISTVMISEWLVAEGDTVSEDQILVVLETDKINVEVPSPINGQLTKILKAPGDDADIGDVLAELSEGGASGKKEATPAKDSSVEKDNSAAKVSSAKPASSKGSAKAEEPIVSPAARRVLDENKVDAKDVKGTGKDGRVMKEDVVTHIDQAASHSSGSKATPSGASPSKPREAGGESSSEGREDVVSMSPLRRKIAERLVHAQQTAAILTTFNEVDVSAVKRLREDYGKDFLDKHRGQTRFHVVFRQGCRGSSKSLSGSERGDSRELHCVQESLRHRCCGGRSQRTCCPCAAERRPTLFRGSGDRHQGPREESAVDETDDERLGRWHFHHL